MCHAIKIDKSLVQHRSALEVPLLASGACEMYLRKHEVKEAPGLVFDDKFEAEPSWDLQIRTDQTHATLSSAILYLIKSAGAPLD